MYSTGKRFLLSREENVGISMKERLEYSLLFCIFMTTTNKVSDKNKKSEILDAYNALLERIEKEKKEGSAPLQEENKTTTIQKASAYSENKMQQELNSFAESFLSAIKKAGESVSGELEKVSKRLSEERGRLREIQEALAAEEKHLEESYQIKKAAISLMNLLQAIEAEKKRWQEEKEEEQKRREREEAEYVYLREKKRREEEDAYQEKQQKKEVLLQADIKMRLEAIEEKEGMLKGQEEELQALRKEKEGFPQTLETAISNALVAQKQSIEDRFKTEAQMEKQRVEAEYRLLSAEKKRLEEQLKERENAMQLLQKDADAARAKAQELALSIVQARNTARSEEKPS